MEKTIDQVQEVGSSFFDTAQHVFEFVANTLKPGVDAALPILQQAGEQAVKITSPVISEASKQAQDVIQSAGFDTAPIVSAAKVHPLVLYCIYFYYSAMQCTLALASSMPNWLIIFYPIQMNYSSIYDRPTNGFNNGLMMDAMSLLICQSNNSIHISIGCGNFATILLWGHGCV